MLNPLPNLGQWCDKTTMKTHNKKLVEMDKFLEIDTENQQQIQFKLIHGTTKLTTSKEYSQLLSASS